MCTLQGIGRPTSKAHCGIPRFPCGINTTLGHYPDSDTPTSDPNVRC
jgi:hypothetical protein